jgi:hypothetical protein
MFKNKKSGLLFLFIVLYISMCAGSSDDCDTYLGQQTVNNISSN